MSFFVVNIVEIRWQIIVTLFFFSYLLILTFVIRVIVLCLL